MPVTRSLLSAGGPAYATFNSQTIQFVGDVTAATVMETDVIQTALRGAVDEIKRDMIVKVGGQPRFYDTAALATLFPYIATPVGTVYPGASDLPLELFSNNKDTFTAASALVGKMPDLELGVSGAVLGAIEFWGVIANSADATTANSYYTMATAGSYSNPAVPSTAVLGQQEFTAAWGSVSGFTSFQAQEKWSISHELKLEPVVIQGRTRAFKLASYRCMAKCKPLGPTWAQIDAALAAQGTGAGGGTLLSAGGANLVITGSSSMTVTLGNAALKSAGYVFAGKALRYGELGWVSTLGAATTDGGSTAAALALA